MALGGATNDPLEGFDRIGRVDSFTDVIRVGKQGHDIGPMGLRGFLISLLRIEGVVQRWYLGQNLRTLTCLRSATGLAV